MLPRKTSFIELLLSTLFISEAVFASNCTPTDALKVNKCFEVFQNEIFMSYNLSSLIDYYNGYINKTNDWEGIEEICAASKSLHECLGPELIENCININDFFFSRFPSYNRLYVSNFLQINYYCGDGYDVLKNNFNCLMKGVQLPFNISANDICDKRLSFINAKTAISFKKCGTKKDACFTKIYETIGLCIQGCEYCKTLDKNATNYLCDDLDDILDEYSSAASNVFASVVLIISLLFIF